jgi:hypothetical protein
MAPPPPILDPANVWDAILAGLFGGAVAGVAWAYAEDGGWKLFWTAIGAVGAVTALGATLPEVPEGFGAVHDTAEIIAALVAGSLLPLSGVVVVSFLVAAFVAMFLAARMKASESGAG